jgi:hypothetical protein
MTFVQKVLHAATTRGFTGIYYFPDDGAMYTFVQGRVDPMIDRNPDVEKYVKKTNNATLKNVGLAQVYFFGMKGKTQKESTAADIVAFDEYDLMNPEDVDIAEQRVAASEHKIKWRLGNPTFPDTGIDALFKDSDMKYWGMKCPHCNRRNFYLLDNKFDPAWVEQGFLACQKCRKPVDVTAGEWVPFHPGRPRSGYQVSRLFAKNADILKIFTDSRRSVFTQNFYNRTLGLAWTDTQTRVTPEHVLKMCGLFPMPTMATGCSAGIDVNPVDGHRLVISRPGTDRLRDIVHLGVYTSLDDMYEPLRRFDVKRWVIDAQPDKEGAMKMAKAFRGKGWLCYYQDNRKGPYDWKDEDRTVTVDRTQSLDASHRILRDSLLGLPARTGMVEDFANECSNLVRVLEKNEKTGATTARWVELVATKRTDFRHAFNYDVLAGGYAAGETPAKQSSGILIPPNIRDLMKKEWR